ncbi:MAG: UvrD-helicase domain-containing protein [Puniceicoccales bacterium]
MPPPPDNRPPLADQPARNRFKGELDRNFSVMASAGAGKTTAIVDRVVALARADAKRDESLLTGLTVVTYGREAASEMRRRAATALREANVGPIVQTRFQQAYFGTIHSFCLELLRAYGPLAGLSPTFTLTSENEALWREFVRASDNILSPLPEQARSAFSRLASIPKTLGLVHQFGARIPNAPEPPPLPTVNLSPVINFEPEGRKPAPKSQAYIDEAIRRAKDWQTAWNDPSEPPCPLPECGGGGKEFVATWEAAWRPLRDWLGEAALYLAASVGREFREFRIARGSIIYDDMIAVATRLLEHPTVGQAIRDSGRIVILDEAQDTDWLQYFILLNVAGAVWRSPEQIDIEAPPPPGRFCQVGDPQQAIYSSRADPKVYRQIHHNLLDSKGVEEITFSVTMRCDQAVAAAVNQFFPHILRPQDAKYGQAQFVELTTRPDAGPGQVQRVRLPHDPTLPEKPKPDQQATAEADAIAQWLAETGPDALNVTDWSQVAILASRNSWIDTLAGALDRAGLPVQAHSRAETRASEPAWTWSAALFHVISHPEDQFELIGLLRELFALSDSDIACHYRDTSLQSVTEVLELLNQLRRDNATAPLSEAVHNLIEGVQLRERLNSLPGNDSYRVDKLLARLNADAMLAEERGQSLSEWSRELVASLGTTDGLDEPKPDHIQLLTCHKSKGLQWQVVIAPMLFREHRPPHSSYPMLYQANPEHPAAVAFDKTAHLERSAEAKTGAEFEHARLAYVAWTRARERLIFIDADALYAKPASSSWLGTWNVPHNGPNAQAWVNLPGFTANKSPTKDKNPARTADSPDQPVIFRAGPSNEPHVSELTFPQRVIPSSLARHSTTTRAHERDESDLSSEPGYPEIRTPTGGTGADYGNWWHNAVECAPWGKPSAAWESFLATRLPDCPDRERGSIEWHKLLSSNEFPWVNEPNRITRAEVSLLWPEATEAQATLDLYPLSDTGPDFAYDGFIDLLVEDPDSGTLRAIDWKTDRVGKNPAKELTRAYGRQLGAYVQALSAIFNRPVEGWLYSTRASEWIRLDG